MAQDRNQSLAASITPLDGNTRFRVTLKSWRWSDGTQITTDDVLFGWQRIEKLGDLYAAAGQGGIPNRVAEMRRAGPAEIDIILKKPANPDWFILNGLSLLYPLPRHAWGDIDGAEMWRRRNDPSLYTVTDGPFSLTEFQPDRYIAYTANPLYGGHPAGLRRLVVTFPPGGSALHALKAGELDMARVPNALWQRMQETKGFRFHILPEPYGYWALVFNLRANGPPFLRDALVRHALTTAADQANMIRLVYHGFGTENRMPAPAFATWRTPVAPGGTDAARAAAELDRAGWKREPGDAVRHRNRQDLTFTVLAAGEADSAELQMLQILQSDLAKIGVQLRLQIDRFDDILQTVQDPKADWDAASLPFTLPPVPDGTGYFDTGGGSNFGAYTDPRMDQLIHDSTNLSGAPALAALHGYQAYAAARQPVNFLPQGNFLLMVANRLHGVEAFSNAAGFWAPEFLSVDDPACRLSGDRTALP